MNIPRRLKSPCLKRPRYAVLAAIVGTMMGVLAPPQNSLAAGANPNLVAQGRQLFFQETFGGNGRTCGTCHPAENNFTLDPAYIARLPDLHPLFVAEFNPALKEGFENPRLMREFALIKENLDGFDDLRNRFVMRSVPHTFAMSVSVASPNGPRTGWSGDGAPGDGGLRAFSTGAVIQHFTQSLNRVPGVDFRLPTSAELDAIEAYMLSLGRQQDLSLPLPLKGTLARRGQEIFLDNGLGKCNLCHQNAGANASLGGVNLGNASFDTGVENMPESPARLSGENLPRDDGFGTPGDGQFNTPPLVEAADTPPFFHNNAVRTLEGAVAFYNSDAFNDSPAGRALASLDPKGGGIKLDTSQVESVAAFLRVINALENIRQSRDLLQATVDTGVFDYQGNSVNLNQATKEMDDAIRVLNEGGLHPPAVKHLMAARQSVRWGGYLYFLAPTLAKQALVDLDNARRDMLAETPPQPRLAHWSAR